MASYWGDAPSQRWYKGPKHEPLWCLETMWRNRVDGEVRAKVRSLGHAGAQGSQNQPGNQANRTAQQAGNTKDTNTFNNHVQTPLVAAPFAFQSVNELHRRQLEAQRAMTKLPPGTVMKQMMLEQERDRWANVKLDAPKNSQSPAVGPGSSRCQSSSSSPYLPEVTASARIGASSSLSPQSQSRRSLSRSSMGFSTPNSRKQQTTASPLEAKAFGRHTPLGAKESVPSPMGARQPGSSSQSSRGLAAHSSTSPTSKFRAPPADAFKALGISLVMGGDVQLPPDCLPDQPLKIPDKRRLVNLFKPFDI